MDDYNCFQVLAPQNHIFATQFLFRFYLRIIICAGQQFYTKRLDILPFAQAVELRKFAAAEGQIDIASCGRPAAPRELNASGKNDRVKKVIHQKSKTKEFLYCDFLYCDFYCAERRRIVKKHSAAQQSGNAPANIFENEKSICPLSSRCFCL